MFNGQRLDAIDTRWVFRAYAVLAGLGGFVLFAWGQIWFGTDLAGQPFGKAALIRVLGSITMAAGCCAAGFAATDSPLARRRALLWFAVAHTVVWLVVLSQQIAIWSSGLAERVAELLFGVAFTLFYLWAPREEDRLPKPLISLFGSSVPDSEEQLRSQYEQQIREVAKQEERNRLARDLHDSIKQQVFVIQTAAATSQARFDEDPAGAKAALEQIRASAREAMTEMQVMLDQLRAVPLENAGLIEALKKLCEALGFRTGARVEFKPGILPPSSAFPPGAHEAILRAAQEALANVGRHARAGNVLVSLSATREYVELKVQDDGAGFAPEHSARGQGIANMHARVEEFGGRFDLVSRPGGGTSVVVSLPYQFSDTPREYRKRAIGWVSLLVGLLILSALKQSIVMLVPVLAMALVNTVRNAAAYRRVQARGEAV